MNREEKTELLAELNGIFKGAESVVLAEYIGLTVAEAEALRKKIREAGASLRVTKNRIARLALKDTKFEGLADLFKGPVVMAYASDPIAACKACVQFAKENEKLVIVGGALSDKMLTKSKNWLLFRLWTNCVPNSSVCCKLLLPNSPEYAKHTAKKKLLNFWFDAA